MTARKAYPWTRYARVGRFLLDHKVRGDDGDVYILRHDVPSDAWELTLFSAGGGVGPRLSST